MYPRPEPAGLAQETHYSPAERDFLLALAHEAINSALKNREAVVQDIPESLKEPRGVFTTLYLQGEVRGCVGYIHASAPLFQAVIETARAAAFQDIRFLPVNQEEARRLSISISVISPMFPITPEEIVLGKHGLLITLGSCRGLLLPQVPIEHGWDLKTFLQQTCRKAGLPPFAWQEGATLEGFTAEVFGENPEGAQ
jgi:AmmeMemoRadiSam system protein A